MEPSDRKALVHWCYTYLRSGNLLISLVSCLPHKYKPSLSFLSLKLDCKSREASLGLITSHNSERETKLSLERKVEIAFFQTSKRSWQVSDLWQKYEMIIDKGFHRLLSKTHWALLETIDLRLSQHFLHGFKDVHANCFCARKFTCHVIHRACTLSTKMNNDREDGHCYSFSWI